jgi:hypothetical protein
MARGAVGQSVEIEQYERQYAQCIRKLVDIVQPEVAPAVLHAAQIAPGNAGIRGKRFLRQRESATHRHEPKPESSASPVSPGAFHDGNTRNLAYA